MRRISLGIAMVRTSAAKLLLAVMLLSPKDAWPCSFEILSIERLATQSQNIVVGTIEAVDGEIVEGWAEPDAEFQLRALKSAEFRIDGSLKGNIAAERIELSFQPDMVQSSCGDLLFGFEPGHRMILMLGSAGEDGRYPAPLIWPRRMALGRAAEAYREFPLYQYVAGLGASGIAPIRVGFEAPEVSPANSQLNIELEIDNDLEGSLQVRIGAEHPPSGVQAGAVLWIQVSGIQAVGAWPEVFVVEPLSSHTIRLAEHFVTTDAGRYQWMGYLDLPDSPGGVYRDHWYEPGSSLYVLTVDKVTGVAPGSWGRLKSEGHPVLPME